MRTDALQCLYFTTNFAFAFTSVQLIIPTKFTSHVHASLARSHIAPALFNQLFIVTVRNSIHYDLFHVRQNRSYDVGICLVEGKKGTRTNNA